MKRIREVYFELTCREISRVRRIPGGKTLELYVKICSGRLEDIVISGDFFAHPEEAIEEIERDLRGVELVRVNEIIEKHRSRVFFTGFSFNEFAEFINEVVREASGYE